MKTVKLYQIAHARSGDKGDGSNVGIIADHDAAFAFIKDHLTVARVKAHFAKICHGDVDRYELANLRALNFILHDSLGGGGTESIKTDAQGKTHAMGLLQMDVEVPDDMPVRDPR